MSGDLIEGVFRQQLPFRLMGEALRNTPEEPECNVRGMVGRGLGAGIGGGPKGGKTTLVFGMVKATVRGEPFLGYETMQSGVLVLTEERESTLKGKWSAFGFDDEDDVHLLMRYQASLDWPE